MEIVWLVIGVIIIVGALITLAMFRLNSFESLVETPFFKWWFKGKGERKGKPNSGGNHLGDPEYCARPSSQLERKEECYGQEEDTSKCQERTTQTD